MSGLSPAAAFSAAQRRALAAIFAAALLLRLAYAWLRRGDDLPFNSDPYYYSLIARHLLEGAGFVELKSRAYRPPGLPWFLAGVYALCGVRLAAARAALALVGALHCLAQAAWVRRLASPRAGVYAALLTALYPQFIRYPTELYAEPLFLCLQAAALALLLAGVERQSHRLLAAAGIVCGLSALTRELGLLLPAAAGLWWLAARLGPRRGWLTFTAATALTVLPWTVRNHAVLHTFVPISTNTGINLYIGNNPQATGDFIWVLAPGVDWDDGGGELAAHREGARQAVRYALSHPGRTLALALKKAWILWRPPLYGFGGLGPVTLLMRLAWLAAYLALLALTVAGWQALRAAWPAPLLPLALMVLATLSHMAAFADTRFRLPLEALLVYSAAVGWESLAPNRRPVPKPTSPE